MPCRVTVQSCLEQVNVPARWEYQRRRTRIRIVPAEDHLLTFFPKDISCPRTWARGVAGLIRRARLIITLYVHFHTSSRRFDLVARCPPTFASFVCHGITALPTLRAVLPVRDRACAILCIVPARRADYSTANRLCIIQILPQHYWA